MQVVIVFGRDFNWVASNLRKSMLLIALACISKLAGMVSPALEGDQKFASQVACMCFLLFE